MFELTFKTDNAAFSDGEHGREVARILRKIADKAEQGLGDGAVQDINGNTIGSWWLDVPDEDEDAA